jgi:hypothetical protein
MSDSNKKIIQFLVVAVIGLFLVSWVIRLALGLLSMVLPVLVVGGIAYVAYKAFGPKSIGSGGRRTLP